MANIVAIAGSPSHPSRAYSVLEYAKAQLAADSLSTDIVLVRDLPPEVLVYAQFDHPALKEAIAQIESASSLIISTPVYKASYTGVLKAFLDLLPQKALVDKVILPIVTGGTIAHLLAIDYALKPVLSVLGAQHILSGVYLVDSQIQRLEDGNIQLVEEAEERLQQSLAELARLSQQPSAPSRSYAAAS